MYIVELHLNVLRCFISVFFVYIKYTSQRVTCVMWCVWFISVYAQGNNAYGQCGHTPVEGEVFR